MAKRKRKSTTNRTKKTANKQDMNIGVIGTIIFSVLLAILLYTNSGEIGQKLNEVLGGLMGVLRYILPIGTFAIAIQMACKDEEDYVTKRLVQYTILLICIAVIMSVYEISTGNLETVGDMSQNLKRAYSLGVNNQGGGAVRNTSGYLFSKNVRKFRSCCTKCGYIDYVIYFCLWNRPIRIY